MKRFNEKYAGLNNILMYFILVIATVMTMLPFLWLLSSSFKPIEEIFRYPPAVITDKFTLDNYIRLFREYGFGRVTLNSTYIAGLYTAGAVFLCSLGGYTFSKFEFKGKALLFFIVLGSMMIPFEAIMVPLYIVFNKINWIDRHIGLIIPTMANAFGIFFMRQYANGVSNEIIESGRIDGCKEFRIFLSLILPIVKPAMASLGIIFFMNSWNDFLWPLIVLKSEAKLTVGVALRAMQQGVRTPFDMLMAGSVTSILPLMAVFFIFQKQFISGIAAGAVKG